MTLCRDFRLGVLRKNASEWTFVLIHSRCFKPAAQQVVLTDYAPEVEHLLARVERLNQAIQEAVGSAPPRMKAVIESLQALRGIAQVGAVMIAAELGEVSRFSEARQLMAYTGLVPSEDSSGERPRRRGVTKTGNAHLRRIIVEAAWEN
jgi:transposase